MSNVHVECGSISFSKRAQAKKILEDARERQEGIQCQWLQESFFKDILERVRRKSMGCCPNDAGTFYNKG